MSNAFINIPNSKFLDDSGMVSREWKLWLMNPNVQTLTLGGAVIPLVNGGTGTNNATAAFNALSPIITTGDLIIGNGASSSTRLSIGAAGTVPTSNGTTLVYQTPVSAAAISNVINSLTMIASDTSYIVAGYLNINSTLNLNGNLMVI